MLEKVGAASIVLGGVLALVGAPWLLWAFLRSLFGSRPWGRALRPLLLVAVAAMLIAGPIVINRLRPIDLGPLARTVDGEIHLTLTGWDRQDYDVVLAARPQATLVHMANPDVTDETLKLLAALPNLRELDVNGSQVTDAGLAVLEGLPRLETLHIARTAITDSGFRQHLLDKNSLKQLDLTGTAVASKTVREWKAKQENRQALK